MSDEPRTYVAGDQRRLIALWEACGLDRPWNDPVVSIAGFTDRENAVLFVIEGANGGLAGSVAVGEDGHRGWIYRLAVDPDQRGGGIAETLMTAAQAWLTVRGIAKVHAIVRADNAKARRFYARAGFHASDIGIMQRWLTPPAKEEFPAAQAEKLQVVVTHMEMDAPPKRAPFAQPRGSLALLHAKAPPPSFYRYLYDAVGGPWLWAGRLALSDDQLRDLLDSADMSLRVLYVDGVPAGFAELDLSGLVSRKCVRLRHIGLLPSFIGQGYGRYLLTWVVDAAWQLEPAMVETSVRSLDHPNGVALLQQHGFAVVGQEVEEIDDPRRTGLIAPRTPLPTHHHDGPPVLPRPVDEVVTQLFPRK